MRIPLPTALMAAVSLLPFAPPAQAQDHPVAGTWSGSLELPGGQSLPLVFHIRAAEDGTLTSTMDSPAQGATGIPVQTTTFAEGRLVLELPAIAGRYEATLDEEGRLVGTWSQGGGTLPLSLRRGDPTPPPARPQNPVPPFPYRVEEVRFRNPEAGIELAGTLTLPEGPGPFPAVVLITGSGPQNRDEELMGHRPFLVLADHLTRRGIAVLRYDDRGVGESGGIFATATTADFAGDAAAAAAFLRSRPEIEQGAVGLVGHSEGGVIAPMVSVERGGVDFVVLLAGPGLPGKEVLYLQGAAIARAMGVPEPAVERTLSMQRRLFALVAAAPGAGSPADDAALAEGLRGELREILRETPAAERVALGLPTADEGDWIEAQVQTLTAPWFRYFLVHDPARDLRRLQVPVLALVGSKDLQVTPAENLPAIRRALEEGGNPDFTVEELPGLNHLFQTAGTGAPSEYATIQETFAPVALDRISSWILDRWGR